MQHPHQLLKYKSVGRLHIKHKNPVQSGLIRIGKILQRWNRNNMKNGSQKSLNQNFYQRIRLVGLTSIFQFFKSFLIKKSKCRVFNPGLKNIQSGTLFAVGYPKHGLQVAIQEHVLPMNLIKPSIKISHLLNAH